MYNVLYKKGVCNCDKCQQAYFAAWAMSELQHAYPSSQVLVDKIQSNLVSFRVLRQLDIYFTIHLSQCFATNFKKCKILLLKSEIRDAAFLLREAIVDAEVRFVAEDAILAIY